VATCDKYKWAEGMSNKAAVVGLSLKYRPVIKAKTPNCCNKVFTFGDAAVMGTLGR